MGHNNEQFKKLITAMSQYVGPKSGTGKLFTIDGVPYAVHTECAELFDYGIVQAYQSTDYRDLQSRFDEAAAKAGSLSSTSSQRTSSLTGRPVA